VSNTYLEYNAQESLLQIRVQFFIDDFERILKKKNSAKKVELKNECKGFECAESQLIVNYIESNLSVSIDEIVRNLQYLGYQKDNAETVTVYLEIPCSNINKVSVENKFFIEEFHDQKNGVEMKWYGTTVQEYLNKDKTFCSFLRG
jgi:hypothetical protein